MKTGKNLWIGLVILLSSFFGAAQAQTAVVPPGDGLTTETAYEISQLGHFVWMGDTVTSSAGRYYRMTADIDAADTANWDDPSTTVTLHDGFRPIGLPCIGLNPMPEAGSFRGIFDGGGHEITDLAIERGGTDYVGLFGRVGAGGEIKNVRLSGGVVKGGYCVGPLVGAASSATITNCSASVPVVSGDSTAWGVGVGGLVGESSGAMTSCSATGDVIGAYTVGGLIGAAMGPLTECSASGSVSGRCIAGGLAGVSYEPATHCRATGAVTDDDMAGGLVGRNSGPIVECYATGDVTAGGYSRGWAGGLVGLNFGPISASYARGAAQGHASYPGNTGGLVGQNKGLIADCYSVGAVSGASGLGGLVGTKTDSASMTLGNSFWNTETSGMSVSEGGTGKTTAEMRQQATFVGWDFSDVWGIAEGLDYPYLRGLDSVSGTPTPTAVETADVPTPTATPAPHSTLDNSASIPYGDGLTTGTAYRIWQPEHLVWMADTVTSSAGRYYRLSSSLLASATAGWNDAGTSTDVREGFRPIGTHSTPFRGIFDGEGRSIISLTINRADTDYVGLFGAIGAGAILRNVRLEGDSVAGFNYVGGLVGSMEIGATVDGCRADGAVTGNADVGGLVGISYWNPITKSSTAGEVSGNSIIGGLAGYIKGGAFECYSSAEVSGVAHVGGLVARLDSEMTNCYGTGAVTGSDYVGGLVGYGNATVTNSYAAGAVTGVNYAGALIGSHESTGSNLVTSSYWDTLPTGQPLLDAGTSKTQAEMRQQATFVGWDFGGAWGIFEGASYPYLRSVFCGLAYEAEAEGSLGGATVQVVERGKNGTPVTARPNGGFHFVRWSDGRTDNPRTDSNVWGEVRATALFEPNPGVVVVPPGDGLTTETAYLISELGHLVWMSNTVTSSSGRYYTLANDIDASETATWDDPVTSATYDPKTSTTLEGFFPIGTGSDPSPDVTSFRGIFDGQGRKISGLTINRARDYYVGLFGRVAAGGVVRDLDVDGGAVTGSTYVGGMVGSNNGGSLVNCGATAQVNPGGEYSWTGGVGGLVGFSDGTITDCHAGGDVIGTFEVGGLVGMADGSISRSYATGSAFGANSIGGLVGSSSATLTSCYSTAAVRGGDVAGGLAGHNFGPMSDCYATGWISADEYAGGLVSVNRSVITRCYATGSTYSTSDPAGLVSMNQGALTDSYWDTETTGQTGSQGGTGESTAQMMQEATFAGWDFSGVWDIAEGQNYPYLRNLPQVTLAYLAGPNGSAGGATSVTQTLNPGRTGAPVFAAADDEYHFVQWSDARVDNPRTDTNVTADVTVTASFAFGPAPTPTATPTGTPTRTPTPRPAAAGAGWERYR